MTDGSPADPGAHVSVERLGRDLDELATHREPDEPGATRRVFSEAHRAGREWIAEAMTTAGLTVHRDDGGNLIGVRAGRVGGAPLVTGSHSDSVRGGGRYDGMLGVVGGIEAARALSGADIDLDHDLWVVDFLGEEPNDWGLSCIGSRAATGGLVPQDLSREDGTGRSLGDALAAFGVDPAGVLSAAWSPPHAFVELHIEQGPVLESARATIGIVSGIVGVHRMRIELHGRRDHAGTMPMDARIDASCAAAEVMLAVEHLASHGDGVGVGTTGRVSVEPGALNVVPDLATVWVELRSIDHSWVEERRAAVVQAAHAAAERRGGSCTVSLLSDEAPTPMNPAVRSAIASAGGQGGHPTRHLASGAEHDARQLARICPTGMVFVPSRAGRSHSPDEWTSPDDCAAGTAALARTLAILDKTAIHTGDNR